MIARELSPSTANGYVVTSAVDCCRWTLRGTYSAQRVCAARLPGLHWLAVPPPTRTDCPTTGTGGARWFRAAWRSWQQGEYFARAVSTSFVGGACWLAATHNHSSLFFSPHPGRTVERTAGSRDAAKAVREGKALLLTRHTL